MVSPNQCSFVLDQQITDNIVVYQEFIPTLRSKLEAKGAMIFKIDLENAYDRFECGFIQYTLKDVGLPNGMV